MDGSVLVQLGLDGGELPHSNHLGKLLVGDEHLVGLDEVFLEDEVKGVLEDLFGVGLDELLPYFLVERKLHPLGSVLVKALEVPVVH